jgi:hypothetical protein
VKSNFLFALLLQMSQKKQKYISLKEVPKHLPIERGANVINQWAMKGVRDRWGTNGGNRIYLQVQCIGGRLMTTVAWVNDFMRLTQRPTTGKAK